MKSRIATLTGVVFLISSIGFSGSITVIDKANSPGSGTVEVKATVIKKVSLSIVDTGANNLISGTGIEFGDVDADGNVSSTGITGSPLTADKAEYKTSFFFDVTRTGSGNVSLTVQRSVAGNFNSSDGLVVQDDAGAIQALTGAGSQVSMIVNRPEGRFSKDLGIRVYSSDAGNLTSTLLFTASSL